MSELVKSIIWVAVGAVAISAVLLVVGLLRVYAVHRRHNKEMDEIEKKVIGRIKTTRAMNVSVFDADTLQEIGKTNVTVTGIFGDDEYYKMMSAYYEDEIARRRCRSSLVENEPLPPEFEDWINKRGEDA
jgi:hypothetical protein